MLKYDTCVVFGHLLVWKRATAQLWQARAVDLLPSPWQILRPQAGLLGICFWCEELEGAVEEIGEGSSLSFARPGG